MNRSCSLFAGAALLLASALTSLAADSPAPRHRLLVVSVDGLDWRYLRDRDALGLKIPNIRRLLREGQYAQGVVGVYPSVTWPSHTSLITGVRPDQHGILGNRRPKQEGGDYYWNVDLLKARTLWQVVIEHGWTCATVTWPVTVGASVTYNLPERFLRRQGGDMDLLGVTQKATPGLVEEITRAYPSFAQQWMDDRTRTQAVLFLLREKHPDLLLVHLVGLDAEAHEQGPFSPNANAVLEYTDEAIGQIISALPPAYELALVSDHGFERVDQTANVPVLLAKHGISGKVMSMGGVAATDDPQAAAFLRTMSEKHENGIGREIPAADLAQYAPQLKGMLAAFEPADHVMFGPATEGEYVTPAHERGNHGFWPTRRDYRSIFLLWGPGVTKGNEPEMQMLSIAGRLAAVLGLSFP